MATSFSPTACPERPRSPSSSPSERRTRQPSSACAPLTSSPSCNQARPSIPYLAVSGGRYSAIGGGVPLTSEDQVIAGVGVSGGTTDQDIAIVEAAMT